MPTIALFISRTRSEDIEKKLKEGEQREEALIKRITEKDKINAKLKWVLLLCFMMIAYTYIYLQGAHKIIF